MHRRHPSFRLRALLACVPVAGLVLTATVGTASAAHTPANSQAALRMAVQRLLAHWHPTNHAIGRISLKQVASTNWSGYADTGTGFSSVTAKWTQPKITGCSTSGPLTVDIFWVGIDGFSSQSVEQGGTGIICGQGNPLTYFTWWEMFPANNIQPVGGTVKPGDKISASVVRSGTKYTIKVTDSTHPGNSFTTAPQTCSTCKNSSAEWIGERAAFLVNGQVKLSSLANFGTWTVSSATVAAGSKKGTIKTFPDNAITMINNRTVKKVLAKPGPLNSAGNSFKDVWKARS
jgi:Peptidase A4 family